MKVCVIGDSHCAALKRGWNNIQQDFPSIDFTFFASRGQTMRNVVIKNGSFVASNAMLERAMMVSSDGSSIKFSDYDAFLVCGLKASAEQIDEQQFMSSQLKDTLLFDLIYGTASYSIIARLRKLIQKPIFVAHCPLIAAESVLNNSEPTDYWVNIDKLNSEVYAPLNAVLVRQPQTTIVNDFETHPEYSIGSKRLDVGAKGEADIEVHHETEREHMNDKFGEVWIKEFIQQYVNQNCY